MVFKKIDILDLDVHQGDSTAAILQHDLAICTVSIHGEKNYLFVKTNSNLDIALADGSSDTIYLESPQAGTHVFYNNPHKRGASAA